MTFSTVDHQQHCMGEVVQRVTSRLYPFSQLANTLIQREQLKVVQMKYPNLKHSLEYAEYRRDRDVISAGEIFETDLE